MADPVCVVSVESQNISGYEGFYILKQSEANAIKAASLDSSIKVNLDTNARFISSMLKVVFLVPHGSDTRNFYKFMENDSNVATGAIISWYNEVYHVNPPIY